MNDGTACDWDCPEGKFGQGSTCSNCTETGVAYYSSLKSCRQCSNMLYSGVNEFGAKCLGCNVVGTVYDVRRADCLRCGNRYWKGTYVDENSLGDCKVCNGTVSEDGTKCITE